MSGSNASLARALHELRGVTKPTVVGTVTSVNNNTLTAKVEITSGLELVNVRLKAVESEENKGAYMVPKTGSTVIVGFINDKLEKPFVLAVQELRGDCAFVINDGFLLRRGDDSLAKCMDDLISEILKVRVINGVTPDIVKLTAIQNRFQNLLHHA